MQENKKSIIFILFCFQAVASNEAQAFKFTEKICLEYGLGRNWYCEQEDENKNRNITANDILNSNIPPEQKALKLNELWEKQRKIAVITGKKEDLERFLITQRLIAEKGVDFARSIQHIIDTTPQFSISQSYYKSISDESIRESEKQAILDVSKKRYALVFIYNSNCPHCLRQLPIIKNFRLIHKFKVLGISLDDNYFDGLDENVTDEKIFLDPNVQSFPTVLLLDKQSPAKIFISNGLITLDKLEERIVDRVTERENATNN